MHYLGLDVHKETIAVSIAPQHSTEVRRYGMINGLLDAVDKLLKKLAAPGVELRVVYEAGPGGFVICRHLRAQGIACEVVAPSLIPKKASDKVKTDRRNERCGPIRMVQFVSFHYPCRSVFPPRRVRFATTAPAGGFGCETTLLYCRRRVKPAQACGSLPSHQRKLTA